MSLDIFTVHGGIVSCLFIFLSLGCIILWWLMLVLCEIVPVTELCSGLLVQGLLVTLIE